MDWFKENLMTLISLLFGAGGIGFAFVSRIMDRKKYDQEVRDASANADIKGDEFWKARYDVLFKEVEAKDAWWKARYDNLYQEYQTERSLSNEIVKSFRTELNDMRSDYEKKREFDKLVYNELLSQYKNFEEESQKAENSYKERITQLERMVNDYESKLR